MRRGWDRAVERAKAWHVATDEDELAKEWEKEEEEGTTDRSLHQTNSIG